MTGWCAQCRRELTVHRFRIRYVGLRHLCQRCVAWMAGVGMDVEPVADTDPRRFSRRLVA